MLIKAHEDILRHFQTHGKKVFTFKDVSAVKNNNKNLAMSAIGTMKNKELIAPIAKGLYVIFAPEEVGKNSSQVSNFIDQLMNYKNIPYYVGLLSAAQFYGATHHRPFVFQLITAKTLNTVQFPVLRTLDFHVKTRFPTNSLQKVKDKFSYINYSSPALTMYDLLKYEAYCGGIYNVILVIKELLHALDKEDLKSLLEHSLEHTNLQRLGYILDKLSAVEYSSILRGTLKLSSNYIYLSKQETESGTSVTKWRIIDNIDWSNLDDT